MKDWERRLAKWRWAQANPEKIREATKRWRAAHPDRVRAAARERMRRHRARYRVPAASLAQRIAPDPEAIDILDLA